MAKLTLYNVNGEQLGNLAVSDALFGAKVNKNVLHTWLKAHATNVHTGTAHSKTRAEVRGGGAKPWRQKGTGRARHGSRRSPLWVGGGRAFGPRHKDYEITIPKKVRRQAFTSALTAKAEAGEVLVLDELTLEEPKTKRMVEILHNLNLLGETLLIIDSRDDNIIESARNIPDLKVCVAPYFEVDDLLYCNKVVFTKAAVELLEKEKGVA